MARFTIQQIRFVGDALWDKCMAEGKGFSVAAKIMRVMGSEQEATIFEERGDLLKKLKPVSIAEIAKRPGNSELIARRG